MRGSEGKTSGLRRETGKEVEKGAGNRRLSRLLKEGKGLERIYLRLAIETKRKES